MRLLIADGDPVDIQSALSHLDAPGASVLINPQWITPDPSEKLWIACGKAAVDMVQGAGWIPKKGGVEANRGKLFQNIQPDGWSEPINLGVTYAPQIYHIEYADFVTFQADIATYRRFEATGSLLPKLGHYTYAHDFSGVIRYLKAEYARTGQPVELSLDTETEGLDPFNPEKRIVCVQATAKPGIADVVYVLNDQLVKGGIEVSGHNGPWTARMVQIVEQLKWIASQPWIKVIGANFKFDLNWFRVKWGIVFTNFAFDTCNGGSLCEENRANTLNLHTKIYTPELGGYDDLFNQTFDKSKMNEVPKADLLPYAGGDTDACLRNYRKIRQELLADNPAPSGKPAKNSLTSVYLNIVHPALKALHKMEYTGVCVDVERFHEFGADLEGRMHETMAHAAAVIPKAIMDKYGGLTEQGGAPLSKPAMIAEFLFSPTGLNLEPLQVTEKTQKPSTSEYHLSQFKDHPEAAAVIERYLDYKSVAKMHGTYYKGFLNHLRADNRWHPSYIIHKQGHDKHNEQDAGGTVTGRGSATAPAFQCVTGDTEVLTPEGIRTAGEIIDPLISDEAYNPFRAHTMKIAGSKGFQETSNVFKSWRADLLRVRFSNGNELKCTPEHPIYCKDVGWVKAKDLTTSHRLPPPTRLERRPAPSWCTPGVAEVLGLFTAVGNLAMTAPTVYMEFPDQYGSWVQDTLSIDLAHGFALEYVEDKAVVSFDLTAAGAPRVTKFALALPDAEGDPIGKEVRGTTAFYGFLKGLLKGTGKIGKHTTPQLLSAYVGRRDLAVALLRETAMDGITPPKINTQVSNKRHQVLWRGAGAAKMLELAGMQKEGWSTEAPHSKPGKNHTLYVSSVEEAGAGWVYDFTVPTTHDFIANGVLVHNTVPKHSYWGKRLRECIIAPPGHVIVARDYAQGELKVAACWAQEQQMIKAYLNNVDLHTLTAATVNAMSYEEAMFLKKNDEDAYGTLRQKGKAGNFGLLYGMTAYGFMMYADAVYGVKLTIEEAEAMRDAFFSLYPGLPMWHDRQIMEARANGSVRSPLGRVRHLPTINSPIKKVRHSTENQAINSPIQATLVDMMWMSMGVMEEQKPELVIPFGQVHDQGLWYSHEDRVDEALAYSGEVMENLPFEQKFGWKPELAFNTDAEVGLNLAGLEKVAA